MSIQIHQLLAGLEQIAPFSLAENWDNVGLLVGNPEACVSAILLGLDPSIQLLDEAIARGADTIITHHPIIFHPLATILTNSPAGLFFEKALTHKMNVIACHTNLDNAAAGVSDALAEALGLTELTPLRPRTIVETGAGRIGSFNPPLTASAFMDKLFDVLKLDTIQIAGQIPAQVKTMALCGGSGSELAEIALLKGAGLYLSAEIKHNTARWAEECGFCVIDGTHYGTEKPAMSFLHRKLQVMAELNRWSLELFLSTTEKHPFTCYHKNDPDLI
jgi:dinuclear metal center YbgI/SA1388 family protein